MQYSTVFSEYSLCNTYPISVTDDLPISHSNSHIVVHGKGIIM